MIWTRGLEDLQCRSAEGVQAFSGLFLYMYRLTGLRR